MKGRIVMHHVYSYVDIYLRRRVERRRVECSLRDLPLEALLGGVQSPLRTRAAAAVARGLGDDREYVSRFFRPQRWKKVAPVMVA